MISGGPDGYFLFFSLSSLLLITCRRGGYTIVLESQQVGKVANQEVKHVDQNSSRYLRVFIPLSHRETGERHAQETYGCPYRFCTVSGQTVRDC